MKLVKILLGLTVGLVLLLVVAVAGFAMLFNPNDHKDFITAATKTTGGGAKSRPRMVRYFEFVESKLLDGSEDEEIVKRLSGRRVHPASGRVYHAE
mgnify:CR=1 FL=1